MDDRWSEGLMSRLNKIKSQETTLDQQRLLKLCEDKREESHNVEDSNVTEMDMLLKSLQKGEMTFAEYLK